MSSKTTTNIFLLLNFSSRTNDGELCGGNMLNKAEYRGELLAKAFVCLYVCLLA